MYFMFCSVLCSRAEMIFVFCSVLEHVFRVLSSLVHTVRITHQNIVSVL